MTEYQFNVALNSLRACLRKKQNCIGINPSGSCDSSLFLNECGDWVEVSGGGTPSLPLNSIQYNDNGTFYGDALHTIDPVTKNLSLRKPQTGNIEEQFFQSDNLLGFGIPGTFVAHMDTGTGERVALGLLDLSGFGGSAFAVNLLYTLGTKDVGLVADSAHTYIAYTDSGSGENSQFEAKSGEAHMSYTANGTTLYYATLSDGIFKVRNETTSTDYFTVDITNSAITINPALVPVYADDAAGILGGLTSGRLYQTTSGGSTFLKMIP